MEHREETTTLIAGDKVAGTNVYNAAGERLGDPPPIDARVPLGARHRDLRGRLRGQGEQPPGPGHMSGSEMPAQSSHMGRPRRPVSSILVRPIRMESAGSRGFGAVSASGATGRRPLMAHSGQNKETSIPSRRNLWGTGSPPVPTECELFGNADVVIDLEPGPS